MCREKFLETPICSIIVLESKYSCSGNLHCKKMWEQFEKKNVIFSKIWIFLKMSIFFADMREKC